MSIFPIVASQKVCTFKVRVRVRFRIRVRVRV